MLVHCGRMDRNVSAESWLYKCVCVCAFRWSFCVSTMDRMLADQAAGINETDTAVSIFCFASFLVLSCLVLSCLVLSCLYCCYCLYEMKLPTGTQMNQRSSSQTAFGRWSRLETLGERPERDSTIGTETNAETQSLNHNDTETHTGVWRARKGEAHSIGFAMC